MIAMKRLIFLALVPLLLAGCQSTGARVSETDSSPTWPRPNGAAPALLLATGDEIEVIVHTAPDLSRSVKVGPDGTFQIPYSGPIQAATRSIDDVRRSLRDALSSELRDPDVEILPGASIRHQIFVGGNVKNPGLFDLPGTIDPLQAIELAGGYADAGRRNRLVLLRRLPDGDIRTALADPVAGLVEPNLADWAMLQRFDVIYVTDQTVIDQELFVHEHIREALPLAFFLFYENSD